MCANKDITVKGIKVKYRVKNGYSACCFLFVPVLRPSWISANRQTSDDGETMTSKFANFSTNVAEKYYFIRNPTDACVFT